MTAKSTARNLWETVKGNALAQLVALAFGLMTTFAAAAAGASIYYLDTRFDPITIGVQNLNSRVEKLEGSDRVQDRSIDNHENRMNTGRADCEAFQEKADRQFEKIDDKLDTISESVAGIEALINQRLPVRRTSTEAPAWPIPQ